MNKFIKIIVFTAVFFSTSAFSEENSTLLLSQEKNRISIDFLNSDNITALQFDVVLSGLNKKSISLGSCISGLPSSHTGTCQFKGGVMRVVIYSTNNETLDSGNIGTISLGNFSNEIKVNKLVMGTVDLKQIKGEVLIDVDYKKPILRDREMRK